MSKPRDWKWSRRVLDDTAHAGVTEDPFQRFLTDELRKRGLGFDGFYGPHGDEAVMGVTGADDSPLAGTGFAFPTLTKHPWLEVRGLGEPSEAPVAAWSELAAAALARLDAPMAKWSWSAIIGPQSGAMGESMRLLAAVDVGPLSLVPHPEPIVEYSPSDGRSNVLGGVTTRLWWPVMVHGRCSAHHWEQADPEAGRQLHRLVALLSLVWDRPMSRRAGPSKDGVGIPNTELNRPHWLEPEDHSKLSSGTEAEVPAWLDPAWSKLDEAALGDAVAIHHEAMALQWGHPSVALVCFMAALERVGSMKGTARPPREIRQALTGVLGEEDIEVFFDLIYHRRNRTAHDGELLGGENVLGDYGFGRPWKDPAFDTTRMVYALRSVSRTVLIRALLGAIAAPADAADHSA